VRYKGEINMIDHELRMSAYVRLALLSHQKQQALPRDRFLLLAGCEAYRAGWPDVGRKCRELLLKSNPHHQAGRFPDLSAALRDADFEKLRSQQERHCPPERAEHLLEQLGFKVREETQQSRGDEMLSLLGVIE
jgi:hypothetical protein